MYKKQVYYLSDIKIINFARTLGSKNKLKKQVGLATTSIANNNKNNIGLKKVATAINSTKAVASKGIGLLAKVSKKVNKRKLLGKVADGAEMGVDLLGAGE